MPVSEIDDIFASKGKQKAQPTPPVPSSSSSSSLPDKKKSKKKKKKRDSTDKPADQGSLDKPPSQKKRPAPETVVDPSTQILAAKRPRTEPLSTVRIGKPIKADADKGKNDEDKFKDSRGSGPRRKTDEGWSIYKEDELGIKDEGGDTPLCPFDCECCY